MTAFSTQDITFGDTAAVLVFESDKGRPSAVTFTVRSTSSDDTSDAESALTGSASIETNPNTTLSAVAGASESNPTALTLTSGTGVTIGRRYLLTEDSTGVSETVEVIGVNGTAVTLRHPLRNNYTAGAAFVSTRATQVFDSTWVADVGNLSPGYDPNPNWRAKVSYTVGGTVYTALVYFDLVRYPARHGVTPVDVDARFPGWLDSLPPDYQFDQGRALIDRSFRMVRMDLYQDGKADQAMRNGEAIAELVITRAMLLKLDDDVLRGADIDGARPERAQAVYAQRYNSLIRSPTMPMDESGGGGAVPIRPKPLWVR